MNALTKKLSLVFLCITIVLIFGCSTSEKQQQPDAATILQKPQPSTQPVPAGGLPDLETPPAQDPKNMPPFSDPMEKEVSTKNKK
jgi:PBP1b-binding outer membrane lipoprotein LpoB